MGRRNRKQDTIKRVALGGTLAAIAGYIAGILTAPKSGKQTRKDIKVATDKGVAEAEKDLKKIHTELSKLVDDAKGNSEKVSVKARKELDGLVDKAKDTKEKAREMISAIHEGKSDDRDLKKAIDEANVAIEHLRDFLKK